MQSTFVGKSHRSTNWEVESDDRKVRHWIPDQKSLNETSLKTRMTLSGEVKLTVFMEVWTPPWQWKLLSNRDTEDFPERSCFGAKVRWLRNWMENRLWWHTLEEKPCQASEKAGSAVLEIAISWNNWDNWKRTTAPLFALIFAHNRSIDESGLICLPSRLWSLRVSGGNDWGESCLTHFKDQNNSILFSTLYYRDNGITFKSSRHAGSCGRFSQCHILTHSDNCWKSDSIGSVWLNNIRWKENFLFHLRNLTWFNSVLNPRVDEISLKVLLRFDIHPLFFVLTLQLLWRAINRYSHNGSSQSSWHSI
jgi:hypothetical protein